MRRRDASSARPKLPRTMVFESHSDRGFPPLAPWQQGSQKPTSPALWGGPCSRGKRHTVLSISPACTEAPQEKAPSEQERGRTEKCMFPTCTFLLQLSYQLRYSQIIVPRNGRPAGLQEIMFCELWSQQRQKNRRTLPKA